MPERSGGEEQRSRSGRSVERRKAGTERSLGAGEDPCRRSLVTGSAVPGRRSPEEKWRRGGAPGAGSN
ncbi:unnamed protein product [Linum trigynum]|uniref:Uncharacterized protein n=1 Tax=Linum trigynum TaxID=586398 RepID=A0AAV2CYS8_9ROSI